MALARCSSWLLVVLAAAGVMGPPAVGGAQSATAARPFRRPASVPTSLKTDDFAAVGEVEVPPVPLGVSADGMVGQARAGQATGTNGGAPTDSTSDRSAKGLSRGQPKPRPQVDKAHQDKLHEEFLSKPDYVVNRNIKSQTAGSVAARIEAASLTRTPPDDFYMCAGVYMRELGEQTPLIRSLCTWWAQTRDSVPEAPPPVQSALTSSDSLLCKQIRKPRQCYRFDGDPFVQHPRLNDFTKHCSMSCLGKTTEGSREGVGGP